ncbi:MAG TPA: 16S rRNA (uracil(1498)-N(3))-methyltransferase, partial [Firmicutes bacterium]|nr:16S rRNA (uracil(1498)-N(3))-methyltransferase [Bacillota bacterium]
MNRFFVPRDAISQSTIEISGNDLRHIRDVLRLGPGDHISVLDGYGNEYECRISAIGHRAVRCEILSRSRRASEPSIKISLVQGLPKGDKMDQVVRACTELGVSEFFPAVTERTVVRPDPASAVKRVERLQRIATEASKQSGRAVVPVVHRIEGLPQIVSMLRARPEASGGCGWIVPWELENGEGLRQGLMRLRRAGHDIGDCDGNGQDPGDTGGGPGEIVCFIGPEGGLSRDEVAMIREAGGIPVSLGPRILRTETAGIAVVSAVLYEFGDL